MPKDMPTPQPPPIEPPLAQSASLAARYDPFRDPVLSDPYPFFAQARCQAPVFYSPLIDHWVVSRYEDIARILMDHETFSARNTLTPITPLCPAARQALEDGGWRLKPALGNNDEPDHKRVRNLVRKTFLPAYVKAKEPRIRSLTEHAVAKLADRTQADLVADLIADLPARIILDMLGFADDKVETLIKGGRNRVLFIWGQPDAEEQTRLAHGMAQLFRFCADLIDARMAAPEDDFTSDLIRGAQDGTDRFSRDELASVLFAFFTAGHETTATLMANTVFQLLRHRQAWNAVRADPTRIAGAVEEVLRYDSSVIAWRRIANREAEVNGVAIPKDGQILLLLGSANRDPDMFEEPEAFDIARKTAGRHLSFGKGIHTCLGNTLARAEVRILVETLASRLPDMRLARDHRPTYLPSLAFHGIRHLPVTLR
ncbi:MAG: cytochrome P450 [Alphaproteobacteria bacterium]|nr:MAG: cytochrome P450 [Alphaproteobacteria bacterium]